MLLMEKLTISTGPCSIAIHVCLPGRVVMAYPSHGHISYSPPDMAGADVFEGMRHWADKATWLSGQP